MRPCCYWYAAYHCRRRGSDARQSPAGHQSALGVDWPGNRFPAGPATPGWAPGSGALVVAMVALAATLAVYGLYQYAVELPATRAQTADPDAALRRAGVWYPADSPQRMLFETPGQPAPLATFALTNSLAVFGALAGCGHWGLGRRLGRPAQLAAVGRFFVLDPAGGGVPGGGTCSRSSYLATAVGLLLLGIGIWCRRRLATAVATGAMVLLSWLAWRVP